MINTIDISKKLTNYEKQLISIRMPQIKYVLNNNFIDWQIDITVLAANRWKPGKNKLYISIMSAPIDLLQGNPKYDDNGNTIFNLNFATSDGGRIHHFDCLYYHEILNDFYKKLIFDNEQFDKWFLTHYQIGYVGRNVEYGFCCRPIKQK